jgi:hypothetical protein
MQEKFDQFSLNNVCTSFDLYIMLADYELSFGLGDVNHRTSEFVVEL